MQSFRKDFLVQKICIWSLREIWRREGCEGVKVVMFKERYLGIKGVVSVDIRIGVMKEEY